MENIFKTIKDMFYANSKTIPLEGEMLKRAEALYEVKEGNWTPPQKSEFSEDLKAFEKDGIAATPEKKAFFEALAESCKESKDKLDLKQPELGVDKKQEVYKYRAKCNCVVGGRYYREGEIILRGKKEEVPHFELAEEKS